jgi:hypothetical protein
MHELVLALAAACDEEISSLCADATDMDQVATLLDRALLKTAAAKA